MVQLTQSEAPAGENRLELELGDGSLLVLEEPLPCRVECSAGERITLADAMAENGEPFAGYKLLRAN